jgi:anti-sigma factor RsiW
MAAETHPNDIDLFDYVEDDLSQARRVEIDAHLATCAACSAQVARVEAGRDALRGAQFVHLPERRREGIFMNLPTQVREPRRRRALTPKQLIAVLTPVVAAAAVVAVLVNSNSNPAGQGSTVGAAAAAGAGAGAADTRGASSPEAAQARGTSLSASGTPADVAAELSAKGFDASVQANKVVVKGASENAVRGALADRGPGDVVIVVRGR